MTASLNPHGDEHIPSPHWSSSFTHADMERAAMQQVKERRVLDAARQMAALYADPLSACTEGACAEVLELRAALADLDAR